MSCIVRPTPPDDDLPPPARTRAPDRRCAGSSRRWGIDPHGASAGLRARRESRHATAASLVIVGVAALTGTLGHARARRVRWVPGMLFGAVGIGGSLLGSTLNRLVEPNLLLLGFASLMLLAAGAMFRRQRITERVTDTRVARPARSVGSQVLVVAGVGTVVGFLTGFFGVGGGSLSFPRWSSPSASPCPRRWARASW